MHLDAAKEFEEDEPYKLTMKLSERTYNKVDPRARCAGRGDYLALAGSFSVALIRWSPVRGISGVGADPARGDLLLVLVDWLAPEVTDTGRPGCGGLFGPL